MAEAAEAGEVLAALTLLLPAATAEMTLLEKAEFTALLKAEEKPPPRDMLMTALFWRPLLMMSLTAQLKPSRMMEVDEEEPEKTLTAMMLARLATP